MLSPLPPRPWRAITRGSFSDLSYETGRCNLKLLLILSWSNVFLISPCEGLTRDTSAVPDIRRNNIAVVFNGADLVLLLIILNLLSFSGSAGKFPVPE
jgi:hypothetical protein